jgi:hypothetical protein
MGWVFMAFSTLRWETVLGHGDLRVHGVFR